MPASWHFFQDKCQQKNDFKRSLYKSRRLISNPHFWEYFNFFRFSWRPATATFSPKAEGLRISIHRCTQIHLDQAPTISILNFFLRLRGKSLWEWVAKFVDWSEVTCSSIKIISSGLLIELSCPGIYFLTQGLITILKRTHNEFTSQFFCQ